MWPVLFHDTARVFLAYFLLTLVDVAPSLSLVTVGGLVAIGFNARSALGYLRGEEG